MEGLQSKVLRLIFFYKMFFIDLRFKAILSRISLLGCDMVFHGSLLTIKKEYYNQIFCSVLVNLKNINGKKPEIDWNCGKKLNKKKNVFFRLDDFATNVALVQDLMTQLQKEDLTNEEYKDLQAKYQVRTHINYMPGNIFTLKSV